MTGKHESENQQNEAISDRAKDILIALNFVNPHDPRRMKLLSDETFAFIIKKNLKIKYRFLCQIAVALAILYEIEKNNKAAIEAHINKLKESSDHFLYDEKEKQIKMLLDETKEIMKKIADKINELELRNKNLKDELNNLAIEFEKKYKALREIGSQIIELNTNKESNITILHENQKIDFILTLNEVLDKTFKIINNALNSNKPRKQLKNYFDEAIEMALSEKFLEMKDCKISRDNLRNKVDEIKKNNSSEIIRLQSELWDKACASSRLVSQYESGLSDVFDTRDKKIEKENELKQNEKTILQLKVLKAEISNSLNLFDKVKNITQEGLSTHGILASQVVTTSDGIDSTNSNVIKTLYEDKIWKLKSPEDKISAIIAYDLNTNNKPNPMPSALEDKDQEIIQEFSSSIGINDMGGDNEPPVTLSTGLKKGP